MSDAFTRVLCPERSEEQLASSSSREDGVRSCPQEQDENPVPEPANELAEKERTKERRARDLRDPTAAE